ncbi:MAG: SCO1664 family protein [Chloroflexi bacterium]|nr:SCO1664 family protein [Chloroflexota bacterium]
MEENTPRSERSGGSAGDHVRKLSPEFVVDALYQGDVEILGQILPSSNVTFLSRIVYVDVEFLAVYKPSQGESPLWDFPEGTLCLRETAAYLLSSLLGWPRIPPTALREGRYGIGTFQFYVDALAGANYFTWRSEFQNELRAIALFDLLINNADRKGGHVLLDRFNQIWAIDNALTFHVEDKLRTVIWDFSGQPISPAHLGNLEELHEHLADAGDRYLDLDQLLAREEIRATKERLIGLLTRRIYPMPDSTRRQVPWPLV